MAHSPYIIEVTQDNFAQEVLVRSQQVPVLVDFWAAWCAPCKALMPILSKLVEEQKGRLILAKVNTDQQQALAMQQQIRSLPTVRLYYQGQLANEFIGALPENKIRQFLEPYLAPPPNPAEQQLAEVYQLFAAGQFEHAAQRLQGLLLLDPKNTQLKLAQARLYLAQGDVDTAAQVLAELPDADRKLPEVIQLQASLSFMHILKDAPPLEAVSQALLEDPADHLARHHYAAYAVVQENYELAMQQWLQLVKTAPQFQEGVAQKALVALFNMLGSDDPLVTTYRRKLFAVLH